ncbi:4938_t:CDS:2 [Entrophospora sp. SA101]|nr:4938_t:CDS:2 [Entrophospora sp. SA101]
MNLETLNEHLMVKLNGPSVDLFLILSNLDLEFDDSTQFPRLASVFEAFCDVKMVVDLITKLRHRHDLTNVLELINASVCPSQHEIFHRAKENLNICYFKTFERRASYLCLWLC